jgi:hypothetical protein
MPTVLRESGFAFMIYTDDHRPMHVHVWRQGREAVLEIENGVHIRENYGLNRREMRTAVQIAEENVQLLIDGWRRIHES